MTSGLATGASTRSTSALEHRAHVVGADVLVEAALAQRRDDALGRADAEVGLDEQVFEIVERRRLELASW